MKMKRDFGVSLTLLLALAGFSQPAFAYLDPSTGSMIFSAVLGILATLGLAVKTYWYKLKSFFRGKPEVVAVNSEVTEGEPAASDRGQQGSVER
jgi:hypothetical protein